MKKYILMLACICGMLPVFAQVYQFRFFGRDYGLPQPFIYTINQTSDGFLWAGTGEGLCRFDGRSFRTFTVSDGLAEDFITTTFVDKNGNLWIGHNQGGLTYSNGKRFHVIARGGNEGSMVTGIKQDPQGNVWATQKGGNVLKMDKNDGLQDFTKKFRRHLIYGLELTQEDMLIATSHGLHIYNYKHKDDLIYTGSIPAFDGMQINWISRRSMTEDYWVCTDKAGLYLLRIRNREDPSAKYQVIKVAESMNLEQYNLVHITEDTYGNLWLSTFGNGILQLMGNSVTGYTDVIHIDRNQGFAGDFIKASFEDREKNIWIATYGNGLAMRANDYFAFYPVDRGEQHVTTITADSNGVWTGSKGLVTFFDPLMMDSREEYPLIGGNVEVTTIFSDPSGDILAGTNGKGLYLKRSDQKEFMRVFDPADMLSGHITGIVPSGSSYFISTQGGVYELSRQGKMIRHYTTLRGLLHNTVYDIGRDEKGNIWLANQAPRVQMIDPKKDSVILHESNYNELMLHMSSISPQPEGTWISTYGNGVFLLAKDTIFHFDDRNGLSSNYCYGLVKDQRGFVWAMHRNTLSRISRHDYRIRVYTPGGSVYQDLGFHAAQTDRYGHIWFATEKGLLRYFPDRDKKNTVPPLLRVRNVYADESPLPDTVETPVIDYNTFRVRFALQGLSLRDPHMVRYRYKLEGYDREWSEPTDETVITYTRLPDGKYTFLAEALNADGIRTTHPVQVPFIIEKPFWKRWWFAFGVVLSMVQGTYFFIRYRERRLRKVKQMLKQMLDERTRTVINQKEELEKKNKDITDSIAYARRIQWAILPDIQQLHQVFPEAFIFYKPKDIVSGDFYWMRKFGSKFLLSCADATGHGVPGAFMSLIGSTLLKDITELGEVSDPASVITSLDHQVRSILSKQGHISANDGMDMALCEFDTDTNLLSFSLAMRPLLLIRDGETIIYKGNRRAIGGQQMVSQEAFTCHTIELKEGDMIYLFTDGYHDQFGGSKGKKMMIKPFIKALEQVSWLPIDKQQLQLERKLHHWMNNHEQVDDVLVIGIRYTPRKKIKVDTTAGIMTASN